MKNHFKVIFSNHMLTMPRHDFKAKPRKRQSPSKSQNNNIGFNILPIQSKINPNVNETTNIIDLCSSDEDFVTSASVKSHKAKQKKKRAKRKHSADFAFNNLTTVESNSECSFNFDDSFRNICNESVEYIPFTRCDVSTIKINESFGELSLNKSDHSKLSVVKNKKQKHKQDKKRKKIVNSSYETDTTASNLIDSPKRLKKNKKQTQITERIELGSYQVETQEGKQILTMQKETTVYVYGLMCITVLQGSVKILGKTLTSSTSPLNLFSPRGTSFLSIASKGGAIIQCTKLPKESTCFLEEHIEQVIYPQEDASSRWKFRNYESEDWSVVKENDAWDTIIHKINLDSKVMLFGGKNVGKSTLLRFMVNRLLDRFEEVCVVDLDPGQAEFTIPGCISVVYLKHGLLGPNYTHLQKPDRCIFIPNIDVSDVKPYFECVKDLLHTNFKRVPIIFNNMGYTRGLGINIASFLICEVCPTIVVQIDSPKKSVNFIEDLNIFNVKKHVQLVSKDKSQSNLSYNLIKINSEARSEGIWSLRPRQMREMCIISYIGCRGFNIYTKSLNDCKIIHNGKECDIRAANANLVSLCSRSLKDNQIYYCYGWGIVQGIEIELNYVKLWTPLYPQELENVDSLVLGSVTLPPSFHVVNLSKIDGHVPYVYKGLQRDFQRTPKRSIVPVS